MVIGEWILCCVVVGGGMMLMCPKLKMAGRWTCPLCGNGMVFPMHPQPVWVTVVIYMRRWVENDGWRNIPEDWTLAAHPQCILGCMLAGMWIAYMLGPLP